MVAARRDFISFDGLHVQPLLSQFAGCWQLDRVSGLFDEHAATIAALDIDRNSLGLLLRSPPGLRISATFDGPTAEGRDASGDYCLQALLEEDVLVWELEAPCRDAITRIRRVMRLSEQGSQLVVERVDLNAEGVTQGLRTEYWIRSGQRESGSTLARPAQ